MLKHLLDAREMAHPEPLQISMTLLQTISNEEYLYMLNYKKPIPLLELAKEKGFRYLTHQDKEELWHIIITKNTLCILEELIDV